jgi:hypothetical protein
MTEADEFMRLATSDEPLHPDLLPWLEDLDIGPTLRHPLVYDYLPRPGLVNRRYELKKEALAEALEEGKWHSYVFLHERPYRAQALWDLDTKVADRLSDHDYWELAGSVWVDSENIHQNIDIWEELFDSDRSCQRELMSDEEWEKLRALPEWITAYRGCIADLNEDGLSFTLDRGQAAWFARRFVDSHGGVPRVLVATVMKSNVIAYFSNESEIVVRHDAEVIVERIEEP